MSLILDVSPSLSTVMMIYTLFTVRGEPVIDEVYYLQGFKGGWTKWEEKMNITECNEGTGFVQASHLKIQLNMIIT